MPYREALVELLLYFFANNNVNYARWLSIHLRDIMTIDRSKRVLRRTFCRAQILQRILASIAIDQTHEQNNAVIKDDGGAIDLTEDSTKIPEVDDSWTRSDPSRLAPRETLRVLGKQNSLVIKCLLLYG